MKAFEVSGYVQWTQDAKPLRQIEIADNEEEALQTVMGNLNRWAKDHDYNPPKMALTARSMVL